VTVALPSGQREMPARVDGQAPQGAALVPAHMTPSVTPAGVVKK